MTLEEKVDFLLNQQQEKLDLIIKKQEEKKPRDVWDKSQIMATIITGLLTLALAVANLWTTSKIASQSQKQAEVFHQDQIIEQLRDSMRKERDVVIQELNLLPNLSNMLKDNNPDIKKIAAGLLEKIKSNSQLSNDPISSLAILLKGEVVGSNKNAVLYVTKTKTNSTETNNTNSFWVYLGQKENGTFQPRFFDINELPSPNSVITSLSNVYKHKTKPRQIGDSKDDNWDLGEKVGVISPKSTVTVLETLTLEGNNYWALVK